MNYVVGPNGTGKTLLAHQIRQACINAGIHAVRYISAERLAGFEREQSSFGYSNLAQGFNLSQYQTYRSSGEAAGSVVDAYASLQERPDLRILVQSRLSSLFNRSLRLHLDGGFLRMMVKPIDGQEYEMKQAECHGLKELVALLTLLYDDAYSCLIIDEPEMHLHPQLQTMLMEEIRKIAGDPRSSETGKKLIFIITHSPFIISVRSLGDLESILILQSLSEEHWFDDKTLADEYEAKLLDYLLLRIEAQHRSMFFAKNTVLVEGYKDKTLFELIQEKRGLSSQSSGAYILNTGGKDEMFIIRKLCLSLGLNQVAVTDLDALFRGRLIQSVSGDPRAKASLAAQGHGLDVMAFMGTLKSDLSSLAKEFRCLQGQCDNSLFHALAAIINARGEDDDESRIATLIFLERFAESLPMRDFDLRKAAVLGKRDAVIAALAAADVMVLKAGEIEHYMPSFPGSCVMPSDEQKAKVFRDEIEFLRSVNPSGDALRQRYESLCALLDNLMPLPSVSLVDIVTKELADFIHRVQMAVRFENIQTLEDLRLNAYIGASALTRVFAISEFIPKAIGSFECTIVFRVAELAGRTYQFNEHTSASGISLSGCSSIAVAPNA